MGEEKVKIHVIQIGRVWHSCLVEIRVVQRWREKLLS